MPALCLFTARLRIPDGTAFAAAGATDARYRTAYAHRRCHQLSIKHAARAADCYTAHYT